MGQRAACDGGCRGWKDLAAPGKTIEPPWARPTCPQCPQDPVPCVPSATRAGLRAPDVALAPSTSGPQLAQLPSPRGAAQAARTGGRRPCLQGGSCPGSGGSVALTEERGEPSRGHLGSEQPPRPGPQPSPRPHGAGPSLTCRGGHLPVARLQSQEVLLEVIAGGGQRLGERRG